MELHVCLNGHADVCMCVCVCVYASGDKDDIILHT